jgi:hypothetical protein
MRRGNLRSEVVKLQGLETLTLSFAINHREQFVPQDTGLFIVE